MTHRNRFAPLAVAALAVAAVSLPTMAQVHPSTTQPTTASTDVPVTRVALFSSGVGYFEHFGTVNGDGSSTLHFKTEQVNDVLKSLVLQDLDGGSVSTVSYPSEDPLGHALKGFQVDLSDAPPIAQLLGQLRGAEVFVKTSGSTLTGKILGVETRKRPVKDTSIDYSVLNLVTNAGLQSISIEDATSIQLTDPHLQEELNKALLAVAGARDNDKKSVTVNFRGTGDRHVKLGYVVATPIWKTSYRLVIGDKPEDKSNLQGWAIVENETDSDWNNISLSLVSGRPLSFKMDLYEPLYVERPEVALDLFEGLAPPRYAEAREEISRKDMPAPVAAMAAPMAHRPMGMMGGAGGRAREAAESLSVESRFADKSMDATSSIATAATAGQIGELFEYSLSNITLARQSSAMVPIVTEPIEVTPVSIFNQSVLARYPLTGARIKNTTDKHLLQGPITVFQGGSYAGDAQVNNVPPGQTRLISYGIDLQTLIDADRVDSVAELQGVKLNKGVLVITNKSVSSRHYRMENKSEKAKIIVVEHAKIGGWDLVKDDANKPVETTDSLYRFEKKLAAKQQDELIVAQQNVNYQSVGLIETDIATLTYYASNARTPDAVKESIKKAIDLRQQQADLDRQLGENQQELQRITSEQGRIRENMKTVKQDSDYYARLMKKLEDQETTIDKTHEKVIALTEQRDAKRTELEGYLKDLNVG